MQHPWKPLYCPIPMQMTSLTEVTCDLFSLNDLRLILNHGSHPLPVQDSLSAPGAAYRSPDRLILIDVAIMAERWRGALCALFPGITGHVAQSRRSLNLLFIRDFRGEDACRRNSVCRTANLRIKFALSHFKRAARGCEAAGAYHTICKLTM